jgi:hypothetical protein
LIELEVGRCGLMEVGSDVQGRVRAGQVALRHPDLQSILPGSNVTKLIVAACVAENSSSVARVRPFEENFHLRDALTLIRIPVVVPIDPGISVDG